MCDPFDSEVKSCSVYNIMYLPDLDAFVHFDDDMLMDLMENVAEKYTRDEMSQALDEYCRRNRGKELMRTAEAFVDAAYVFTTDKGARVVLDNPYPPTPTALYDGQLRKIGEVPYTFFISKYNYNTGYALDAPGKRVVETWSGDFGTAHESPALESFLTGGEFASISTDYDFVAVKARGKGAFCFRRGDGWNLTPVTVLGPVMYDESNVKYHSRNGVMCCRIFSKGGVVDQYGMVVDED